MDIHIKAPKAVVSLGDTRCEEHWLTVEQVRLLKQLCHPDRHPDRQAAANKAFLLLDKYPARR